jgi:hypothetical protein
MAGAGWRQWTRERLTAALVQNHLQDQVVQRYSSSSARGTGLPAPSEGMVTTLDDTDAVYRWDGATHRLVTPGAVRARGGLARSDNAATLNANSTTDLTCRTGAATVGGGWTDLGAPVPGYSQSLPGRYLIAANLRTDTGANRWEALLAMVNGGELALADGAVLGGFSGLSGADVVESPGGLSLGFRYITNAGVNGTIRGGSWWSATWLGPIG